MKSLEQDKATAVNAEKAERFADNLKFSETVQELRRKLENKTAEDLGEGAEIDLFEALKMEFEGDRITRINKGEAALISFTSLFTTAGNAVRSYMILRTAMRGGTST